MVEKGREFLRIQHQKRAVVKKMMLFLSHEDDYCDTILDTLREAKKLDIDMVIKTLYNCFYVSFWMVLFTVINIRIFLLEILANFWLSNYC